MWESVESYQSYPHLDATHQDHKNVGPCGTYVGPEPSNRGYFHPEPFLPGKNL